MKRLTFALIALVLVMGIFQGCTTFKRFAYEGFGRDRWQQPKRVIQTLKIQKGETIADLGAGGGYFTFRLTDAVGDSGTVYAADVDDGMLRYLKKRTENEGRHNVIPLRAQYDDPKLPPASIDLLFTVNTYHHLKNRTDYFRRAKKALKPGGRVAIIDFAGKTMWQRLFGHITPVKTIREEMKAAGYRLEAEYTFLSAQHFLIFSQKAE